MRALLTLVCLLVASGCSPNPAAHSSASKLEEQVGQSVTLTGQFELAGKVGPYIQYDGRPVYLVPHGSLSRSSDYERVQGKTVSVTGILRHQHFEHTAVSDAVAQPVDYFYFDADTAQVRLE
jgi:hypothetical protein